MRFEFYEASEHVASNHLAHGQEIAIPPPVVEHREHSLLPDCKLNKVLGLSYGLRHRLLDHNVLAGFQTLFRQVIVSLVRRVHNNELYLRVVQQIFDRS